MEPMSDAPAPDLSGNGVSVVIPEGAWPGHPVRARSPGPRGPRRRGRKWRPSPGDRLSHRAARTRKKWPWPKIRMWPGSDRSRPITRSARAPIVRDRLAARATVAEERPAGPLAADLVGAPAFVAAIIPFGQVRDAHGPIAETGQLARPTRRCSGLTKTRSKARPRSRWQAPALSSPRPVRRKSVRPVCWRVIVHSVSPCRAR